MPNALIVDDSADLREFCGLIAQMGEMRVLQAASADEAQAILSQGLEPDVILLDVMMPGKSPEEFIKTLRADSKLKNTRVVLMSSLSDVRERAQRIDADDFLHKPLDIQRLSQCLSPSLDASAS